MVVKLIINVGVVYTGALFPAAITVLIAFITAFTCVVTLQFVERPLAIHHQGIKFTLEYEMRSRLRNMHFYCA